VDGAGQRPAARGRTGCLPPPLHRASGLIESFPEDHSPARGQPLDAGWRNHPRPPLRPFSKKDDCRPTSSQRDPRGRRPADPQRLGRGATLARFNLPQTLPIPQSTSALSPPVTHKFPGRGTFFEACSAFTRVTTCRLAKSPYATLYTGGFGGFVTSTAAPIATGWSDPVPGRVFLPAVVQCLSRRTVIGMLRQQSHCLRVADKDAPRRS
jgi:hypothetical protein